MGNGRSVVNHGYRTTQKFKSVKSRRKERMVCFEYEKNVCIVYTLQNKEKSQCNYLLKKKSQCN